MPLTSSILLMGFCCLRKIKVPLEEHLVYLFSGGQEDGSSKYTSLFTIKYAFFQ